MAEQPPWIRVSLRPHQLTLLAAAQKLETSCDFSSLSIGTEVLQSRYGVLADRVGAGKSLVALGLVRGPQINQIGIYSAESGSAKLIRLERIRDIEEWNPAWNGRPSNEIAAAMFPSRQCRWHTRTALMIVPHTLISQWETYVKEQTDLKALFIKKTVDCDYDQPGFLENVLTADVVICSATMLKKFMTAFSLFRHMSFDRIVWSRLFIDEADSINISLRKDEVATRFIWFITGSWLNMLYPMGLLSSTVNHLGPAERDVLGEGYIRGLSSRNNIVGTSVACRLNAPIFTKLVLRNRAEWIDTSLQQPIITHETVVCDAPANLRILKNFITPAAMEALHAGDTAGAITALGLKTATATSLVSRVTESLRTDLAQAEKLLVFKKDMEYSTPAAKELAIAKATEKVSRIRDQLTSLEERVASINTQTCPICYDTPRSATLTPCCRQVFCLSCLCECLSAKPSCPLCREKIKDLKTLIVVGDKDQGGVEETERRPTKGAALLKLLTESRSDQRILVFSAYEESFKGLKALLDAKGIKSEMLSGTGKRIDKLKADFNAGKIRILYMNARYVGAGLNLDAATDVILYHRMNTELEKQVVGRAVRFERAGELRVTHLVHDDETSYNGAQSSEVIVHM